MNQRVPERRQWKISACWDRILGFWVTNGHVHLSGSWLLVLAHHLWAVSFSGLAFDSFVCSLPLFNKFEVWRNPNDKIVYVLLFSHKNAIFDFSFIYGGTLVSLSTPTLLPLSKRYSREREGGLSERLEKGRKMSAVPFRSVLLLQTIFCF